MPDIPPRAYGRLHHPFPSSPGEAVDETALEVALETNVHGARVDPIVERSRVQHGIQGVDRFGRSQLRSARQRWTGLLLGSNLVGEGGWGQTNNWARSPIAVVNTYKYDMIVAGGHHTVGRTTAGALVAWGMNAQGQLGNGTTTPASSPIPILP